MKRLAVVILALLPAPLIVADEAADRDAVIQVVVDFFDAMTARDVEKMRSLMTVDGMIYGYREDPEGLQVLRRTHAEYLDSLASGTGKLVERFREPRVMIYERLATVWTPYDFHVDDRFSHCGMNNFSMLRADDGWVITGVVFSIEVHDCVGRPFGPGPVGGQR